MKRQLFFAAMFAASSLAFAQVAPTGGVARYNAANYKNAAVSFDRAIKNLVWCLSDRNEGVVESALSHMIQIRMANPGLAMDKAKSEIKELIVDGSTQMVRYEAFLANAVMENPGLITPSDCDGCNSPEKLFSRVAMRLHDASFGPVGPSYSAKH